MLNKRIAQNIKRLCKEKGISISAMLSYCGINRNFMYNIEKCGKLPRIDTIIKIADFFGVTLDELCRDRTDETE